ncbi:GDSL-type esterase/lipase family protein [Planctomycetota bacterium]
MVHLTSLITWISGTLLLVPTVLFGHLDPSGWHVVEVSSENLITGELARCAIDGDPETQWHTQWHTPRDVEPAQPPHMITIDLGEAHLVKAVRYRARAHGEGGLPQVYSLELSSNTQSWATVASGTFTFGNLMSPHAVVTLNQAWKARFLRLTIFSLHNSDKSTEPGLVVGEIDVGTDQSPLVPTTLLPVPQSREWNYGGYVWLDRHRDLLAYAAVHKPRLVFLGDSITHRWGAPPLDDTMHTGQAVWNKYYRHRNAFSLGCGWDRLENMLWRLRQGELEETDPRLVVLMAGTNNLEVNSPQEIAAGIAELCDEIHRQKPTVQVLLLAIFPRGSNRNYRELNETNRLISAFGQREYITFKDIGEAFLNEQGQLSHEIMPDLLHPSAEGYRRWAIAIESHVARALNETPIAP